MAFSWKGDSWGGSSWSGGGSGPWAGKSWSGTDNWSSGASASEKAPRMRITRVPIPGRVKEWRGSYGWVEPQLEVDHPDMAKHQGHIFVHSEDLLPKWGKLTPGSLVEFHLYMDGGGLGAERCVALKVLRLTLPCGMAKVAFGSDGEGVAEFERTWNVTVRSYEWMHLDGSQSEMDFLLFEVWGRRQALVDAVTELSKRERKCLPRLLVPESRLWKLDLPSLSQVAQSVELSQELTIHVPMACRTLYVKGSHAECSAALKMFISQVCD